jgi:glycosyltransferase involved in cell wall biosynthesis
MVKTAPQPQSSLPVTSANRIRAAVICDFLEEKWPSMDLNGDLLYQFLAQDHAPDIAATQVRPEFRRRLTRLPLLNGKLGWNVDRLANRFLDYPRWLGGRLDRFDLFHLVDHSYSQLVHSLPAPRTIVTCHDLDTFRCLLEPQAEPRPHWFQAMARRILEGFQKAAHVICNSSATRDQLLHYGLFPAERISVIHSGVHPAFGSKPDAAADAEATGLIGPNIPRDIKLLSVGSTIPRKRMDVLLRVFQAVLEEFPSARLLRVGGPFTDPQLQLARDLGVEKSVLVLPFLTRNVLASVYRSSTLLLQPSEAEGFGMPLAEAMACGCPVVASDLASLREIGGAVCEYCPVADVSAWKAAVVRRLQADASQSWRQQALDQAQRYTWSENARATADVYRQVFDQQGRVS